MLKRCVIAIALALCFAPIVLSRPQAAPPMIAGCPLQPADNIWNVPIDNLLPDANSAAYIDTIGLNAHVHADFGSGTWLGFPIGIPYTTVPGTQATFSVIFQWPGESDAGPYPIPPDVPIEGDPNGNGDRHILLVDRDNCTLYELHAAHKVGNQWYAGSGAIFDLNSNALRPDTWTSADAAGLPILPGLARYDEVAAGEINHALRFTAPQTRGEYIWPARHEASNLTGAQYPPLGQRFRLKASFIIDNSFSPHAQVILRALKKYGMILADNGSSWYISGAPDERWDNDVLHELDVVYGSDFEAVDESSLMVNVNSGQALSDFTVSANPIGRAIDAGDVATYQLRFEKSAAFNSVITITASSASPSVTLHLSQASVTPPITITLTITDAHPIGLPPIVYTIPITATGGSVTHYASVSALINGLRIYLPLTRKG
ncbi:MAG: hypothetical protein KA765_04700 [Thermoflexales bacterium]|nr:hypothetical protein [Thermoflexales bacterium]